MLAEHSQCHFAHHKSHTDWAGTETGPLLRQSGWYRLAYGTALNFSLQVETLTVIATEQYVLYRPTVADPTQGNKG